MKFGDDWSKTATCIATQTDKQTDKQTNRQTNILANFFEILASNNKTLNFMEFHGILSRSNVPWNFMELFPYSRVSWNFQFSRKKSIEFYGIQWNVFGVSWNSIRCYRSKWSTISCDNILLWVSIVIYANATQSIYCGQWFHIIQSVPTCIFSTDIFIEI